MNAMIAAAISVPLRGLWFLSAAGEGARAEAPGNFRPLTGIMVLIADEEFEKYIVVRGMFPSPYGDYGSYRTSS